MNSELVHRVRIAVLTAAVLVLCLVSVSVAGAQDGANPILVLEMSTDAEPFEGGYIAEFGAQVTYVFSVSNIGDVSVTDISVDEPVLGHIGDIATLAPGETRELWVTSTTDESEFAGIAVGTDPSGGEVSASDVITVERFFGDTFEDDPWIRKTSSVSTAQPGETVRYTLTYGNQKDSLIGLTTIVDEFDARVLEIVDVAGARVESGRLTWSVPAGLTALDGPSTISYTLRIRRDAPVSIASALNAATISNEFDVDASDNASRVSVTIDAYLGFPEPVPTAPVARAPRATTAVTEQTAEESSEESSEDFLPYTGVDSQRLALIVLAFAVAGAVLRHSGTTPRPIGIPMMESDIGCTQRQDRMWPRSAALKDTDE